MPYLILSFFLSFVFCLILIRLRIGFDPTCGVQKFHCRPVPRLGGLAIYLSLIFLGASFALAGKDFSPEYAKVLVCLFPIFTAGLLEDLTKKISPKVRLLAGFLSGLLLVFLLSSSVKKVDLPLFDNLLQITLVSYVFTAFAVAGVAHGFNIIDGFNGLASGVALMNFLAYAYVAFLHNDFFLLYLSLGLFSATLGFFIWNYPFGLIFLGDSGAYLLGFANASLGVLMVEKYPDLSPWFPFLLCAYPIWETLFSIYRRNFLKKTSPFLPDGLHFHTLIYKRLTYVFLREEGEKILRNAQTAPLIWTFHFLCYLPAIFLWKYTFPLILSFLIFASLYTWVYLRIIKFKIHPLLRGRLKEEEKIKEPK